MGWTSLHPPAVIVFRNNPFLLRELRQVERIRSTLQAWIAAAAGVLSLPLLWPLFFYLSDTGRPFEGNTTLLQMVHATLCLGVGWYGGSRVYGSETDGDTLEAALMLPYRPVEWLTLKLALPVLMGATAVLLALPIYVCAVILGMGAMDQLPRWTAQAGLALLAGLCYPLMSPPVLEAPPDLPGQAPTARRQFQRREATKGLLLMLAVGVLILTSAGRVLGFHTSTYLFGQKVLLWPIWAAVFGLTLAAVVLTASTPMGPEAWERRAARFRLFSCLLFYHLGVGAGWQRVPAPAGFVLLFLPWAVLVLADRLVAQSRADPWSEADLRRIGAISQNPMLLLDYRIHSRRASLVRAFGGGLVVGALLIVVFRWLNGGWGGTVRMLLSGGGFAVWGTVFTGVGGFAATMWQKEVAANAVAPLLLAPLSSRELMKGRLGAACFRALGYSLGMLLPLITLPFVVATGPTLKVLPGLLGVLPLLITTNLCAAFTFSGKGFPEADMSRREQASYWALWGLHLLGLFCCIVAGGAGWVGKPGAGMLACIPALVGFLFHAAAARWMFELKVRRLDAIRQADFTGTEKD